MQKRHFEALASMLASIRPDRGNKFAPRALRTRQAGAYAQWEATVRATSAVCARENPRFNADKFRIACGMES